jgi:hypothetical protein
MVHFIREIIDCMMKKAQEVALSKIRRGLTICLIS